MSRRRDDTITWETFSEGLWKNNPVFIMLLGMCPVLAVTNTAINSLAMGSWHYLVLLLLMRTTLKGPVMLLLLSRDPLKDTMKSWRRHSG